MMNLQPNYQTATASGLYATRRRLIQAEPSQHNPLDCTNPATCPKCIEWRAWARQLGEVNREITARESK